MRTIAILLGLMAVLCFVHVAAAIVAPIRNHDPLPENPVFACTPAAFTATKEDKGLRLHGVIETPAPGYSAEYAQEEPGPDGSLHGTLRLKGPDGMAAQVISKLEIDHVFEGEGDRLTVSIDKSFTWGDQSIECKAAGAAQ